MITILVPAYNEEAVIDSMLYALQQRLALPEDYEILVVDDGSTDRTPELLAERQRTLTALRVVTQASNEGLGQALATGFTQARGRIIVTMDADLTHPPEMVAPLVAGCDAYDFSVGSRYVYGGGMIGVPGWRVAISRVANRIFQLLFATCLRDITSGLKAYRAECVKALPIQARGFEVQFEITIRLLKQGATFVEFPYQLRNRERGNSKMRYLSLIPRYTRALFSLFRYRWHLGKTPYDE